MLDACLKRTRVEITARTRTIEQTPLKKQGFSLREVASQEKLSEWVECRSGSELVYYLKLVSNYSKLREVPENGTLTDKEGGTWTKIVFPLKTKTRDGVSRVKTLYCR